MRICWLMLSKRDIAGILNGVNLTDSNGVVYLTCCVLLDGNGVFHHIVPFFDDGGIVVNLGSMAGGGRGNIYGMYEFVFKSNCLMTVFSGMLRGKVFMSRLLVHTLRMSVFFLSIYERAIRSQLCKFRIEA